MMCLYPIRLTSGLVGCGQCINCRINKQREWTGRILLEAQMYPVSSFVTLTLNPEHASWVKGPGNTVQSNLNKADMDGFLNRLRKSGVIKYFCVGEYGEKTKRAHWHLILFGFDPCVEETRITNAWKVDGESLGHSTIYDLNSSRAAYCAQYVNKKLTKNHRDLKGRVPEHSRMSKGIGSSALRVLEDICYTESGSYLMTQIADVPSCFRLDGRIWPTGLWLRNELRDRMSVPRSMRERNALFDVPLKSFDHIESDFWNSHEEHDLIYKSTPLKNHGKIKAQTGQLPQARKTAAFLQKRKKARARINQGSISV